MNVFLILPAFNEAENLPALLDQTLELAQTQGQNQYQVILVDDGSSDATSEVGREYQKKLPVTVIRHPKNLGLAAAMRTGLAQALALARDSDLIATMDSDSSHSPALLAEMEKKIAEGFDGVVASRYQKGGKEVGLAWHRSFMSAQVNKIMGAAFGVTNVRDFSCGYRMVKASFLRHLSEKTKGRFFESESFVCTPELLLNLSELGAKFAEVPLVLRYDLKKGASKMKVGETIFGYLKLFGKRRLGLGKGNF